MLAGNRKGGVNMIHWIVPASGYVVALGLIGITTKVAMQHVGWQEIVVWTAAAYFVAVVVLFATGQMRTLHFDQSGAWAALSGGLAAGGLICFCIVVRQADLGRAIPYMASYPIVTVVLAALVLSERISLLEGVGIGLVMSGLLVLVSQNG